jgi:glycosyltransferase involved in cell wall biosynthesis
MKHRLLIVTDILDVDDFTYGYIHRWLLEIAKETTHLYVLAGKVGYHTLPTHVTVHSLGGEEKRGKIVRSVRMGWFLLRYIRSYTGVFVIDKPWFVVRYGWWFKLWRKRIGFWYERGDATTALQLARPMLSYIFTPTTHGYHGGGDIKRIVGYGIDTDVFHPLRRVKDDGVFHMVTVGAISSVKDYNTLIRAIHILKEAVEKPFTLTVVGSPKEGEETFASEVKTLAHSLGLHDIVTFVGPMKNHEIAKLEQHADLYISMNTTPSIEKTLMEAAASGLPILTSNRSFDEYARDYVSFTKFEAGDPTLLAERIRHMMMMSHDARHALGQVFRDIAFRQCSIIALADGIVRPYDSV